ncbi:MAG: hypothetical protein AB1585_03050 [Thermodesulfobacteriota bacterium]
MEKMNHDPRGPVRAWGLSGWLLWMNAFLSFFMITLLLLAGGLWYSDRMMGAIVNHLIMPRITGLVQKNPDMLFSLSNSLTTQALATRVNLFLKEDPQCLSRFIKAVNPVLVAEALNRVGKENPEQISLLLKNLEAQALSGLNSHILRNNRPLLAALITTVDRQALGAVWVKAVSLDPRLFSKGIEGLQPAPFSKAFNHTLRNQKIFLSDLLGTLDMGSIAALIDKIAKEHPEFMNELVDKIVELIRKDFMKSGIY